jgi:RHS repeat-associated protein
VLKLDGDTVETETQAYNAANEMTSHTLDGATTSFAYDQYGRMTQKTRTGGYTGTFYYNYGDKLTKVSSNFQGEGTVTYTYSGDQKRRSRSVSGGAMTKYRVDQGFGVVNEENSGGTLLSTYIHHPGRQIGTVLATSEGSTASSGTWAYYFQDAIGSTRSLWDEDGDRLGKYDYTPFGGNYSSAGQGITRKYTGHDWDSTARLYHTAYRNYSPDMGRWISRDPLGMVDGPNVYAYVVNNPISSSDPLGLYEFSVGSLLSSVWAGLEILLSASDVWTTLGIVADECASANEKFNSMVLMFGGIVSPGGGWATAGKYSANVVKGLKGVDAFRQGSAIKKAPFLVERYGGKIEDWKKMKGFRNGNEWHWYERMDETGERLVVGVKNKTKGEKDPDDVWFEGFVDDDD